MNLRDEFLPTRKNFIFSLILLFAFVLITYQFLIANKGLDIGKTQILIFRFNRAYPATISSKRSGSYFDESTWGGQLPKSGDNVVVKKNHLVLIDKNADIKIKSLRVEGELKTSPNIKFDQSLQAALVTGKWVFGESARPASEAVNLNLVSDPKAKKSDPRGIWVNGQLAIFSAPPAQDLSEPDWKKVIENFNPKFVISTKESQAQINVLEDGQVRLIGVKFDGLGDSASDFPAAIYFDRIKSKNQHIKSSYFASPKGSCVTIFIHGSVLLEENLAYGSTKSCIVLPVGTEVENRIFNNLIVNKDTQEASGILVNNPQNDIIGNRVVGFDQGYAINLLGNVDTTLGVSNIKPLDYPFGRFDGNQAVNNKVGFYLGSPDNKFIRYIPGKELIFNKLKLIGNDVGVDASVEQAKIIGSEFINNKTGVKWNAVSSTIGNSSFSVGAAELGRDRFGIILYGSSNELSELTFTGYSRPGEAAISFVDQEGIFVEPSNKVASTIFNDSNEFKFPTNKIPMAIAWDNKFAVNNFSSVFNSCALKTNWDGRLCDDDIAKIYIENGSVSEVRLLHEGSGAEVTLKANSYNTQGVFKFIGAADSTYQILAKNYTAFSINYTSRAPINLKFNTDKSPRISYNGEEFAPYSDGVANWTYDEDTRQVNLLLRDSGQYIVAPP